MWRDPVGKTARLPRLNNSTTIGFAAPWRTHIAQIPPDPRLARNCKLLYVHLGAWLVPQLASRYRVTEAPLLGLVRALGASHLSRSRKCTDINVESDVIRHGLGELYSDVDAHRNRIANALLLLLGPQGAVPRHAQNCGFHFLWPLSQLRLRSTNGT